MLLLSWPAWARPFLSDSTNLHSEWIWIFFYFYDICSCFKEPDVLAQSRSCGCFLAATLSASVLGGRSVPSPEKHIPGNCAYQGNKVQICIVSGWMRSRWAEESFQGKKEGSGPGERILVCQAQKCSLYPGENIHVLSLPRSKILWRFRG